MTRRPPALRRSWLFVPGADRAALLAAGGCGADVLIQELEDFTPPERRPAARALAPEIAAAWRAAGTLAAVRVNPLEGDGIADLEAVMAAAPDIVLLPKVAAPAQMERLEREVARLERHYGHPEGTTELVANIESARGLLATFGIARASPRITGCLVASEDMVADLGAERGPDGAELAYVRARFHLDCVAAGVLSIDCPYTYRDEAGLLADTRHARRLGYRAKSAVVPAHAAAINRVLTPSAAEIAQARAVVAGFEAARASGAGTVPQDGHVTEMPSYLNAKRLLERARALGVVEG